MNDARYVEKYANMQYGDLWYKKLNCEEENKI